MIITLTELELGTTSASACLFFFNELVFLILSYLNQNGFENILFLYEQSTKELKIVHIEKIRNF